jgi:hypothetical protein
VPGAEKGDELRNFVFRQSIGEARHLLPAIRDLALDLLRIQLLANVCQRRTSIRALRAWAMAISAPFIVEKLRACRSFAVGSEGW